MAQSSTSFVSQTWSSSGEDVVNLYSSVDAEITLYTNSQYDTYVSFLSSSEASNLVDEDTDYLQQSTLNAFKSTIGSYDDYSLRVKMTFDDAISVND